MPPDPSSSPSPSPAVLDVRNLRKAYRTPEGELKTIVSIDAFTLFAGAQVGLKGESGSGKTTFLNLVAGIVKADSGSVLVNGQDLSLLGESKRDRLRATTLGCIYQSFNLLQGYTVLENVLLAMSFGAGRDKVFASSLLDRVGLSHRLDYLPRQLSVGQQQRVAVARALANRPRLVLADEPTGNLDPVHARETLALLLETCSEQGAALLVVSHDPAILDRFSRTEDFAELNNATAPSLL